MCITSGESVVSAGSSSPVPNCSHEEADTRVVVHILHALKQGWKTIQVRTVDTAVVTMLVGTYHDLALTQPFGDIWVIFWHRQALQILQHKYHLYKPQRAKIRRAAYIPCFLWLRHKSAFKGKGKKSVWKVGMSMGRSQYLACHPFELLYVDSAHFETIEKLAAILYDKSSPLSFVNLTRKYIFCP